MIEVIAAGTPSVTTSARSVVNTRKLKVIDMKQTLEEAAHSFAESRSSGSGFPAYYAGFIAGAEWAMKLKHDKVKLMCIKDSNKRCNQCHECDVYVLNPSY